MAAGSLTLPILSPARPSAYIPPDSENVQTSARRASALLHLDPIARIRRFRFLPDSCVRACVCPFHRRQKTTSSRKGKSTYARTVASKNVRTMVYFIRGKA